MTKQYIVKELMKLIRMNQKVHRQFATSNSLKDYVDALGDFSYVHRRFDDMTIVMQRIDGHDSVYVMHIDALARSIVHTTSVENLRKDAATAMHVLDHIEAYLDALISSIISR